MNIDCKLMGPGSYLVCLSGNLTNETAPYLAVAFHQLFHREHAKQVEIDMDDVFFMDKRGVDALIYGLRLFGGQMGNFQLVALQPQPQMMLMMTTHRHPFLAEDSWLTLEEKLVLN